MSKLEEPESNIEDNIEYSNQVKKKKRKFKDISHRDDVTREYFKCGELQHYIATENTDDSKVIKKKKKIHSEKLHALVSSCTNEICEETPIKHSKNDFQFYSDELLESRGQNSIQDKFELNSQVTKKKKKLNDICHEYGIEDECNNDKEAMLDRKIENAQTFQVTSSPKKSRRLSKFAKHFIIKNGRCEDMAVRVELSWLQDDEVSEIPMESLNINTPFPIHPLHMYFTRPSRPKLEEIAAAQEANIKIKSGIFTEAEDKKIRDNWSRFCKEHDLNIEPSYFFQFPRMMNMEQRIKFLQYLGHGLEDRLLHRIHYRFKKIFQNPQMRQGRFTKEEDKQILEYLASSESKKPFRDLAQMLNRTNLSIEKRYDFLCSSMKSRIKWSIDLVDKLVNYMLKITKSEDIDCLRNVTFTTKQWLKLSRKMGNISVRKLQRAWKIYIYPRFFADNYVDLVKIKKKIIKILHKRKETDWRSVNWEEIAAEFDGFTAQKIYMLFKQTVNFNVPEHLSINLEDCVDYMKNIFLKDSHFHTAHKFDKFIYKDGHVQYENR